MHNCLPLVAGIIQQLKIMNELLICVCSTEHHTQNLYNVVQVTPVPHVCSPRPTHERSRSSPLPHNLLVALLLCYSLFLSVEPTNHCYICAAICKTSLIRTKLVYANLKHGMIYRKMTRRKLFSLTNQSINFIYNYRQVCCTSLNNCSKIYF